MTLDSNIEMSCDCGTFVVELVGRWPRERILISGSPHRRDSNPEVDAVVERTWLAELAAAKESGTHLYDGKLSRLVEFSREGDAIRLTLGPTSYKEFLGTNFRNAYLRYIHGVEVLSDAVGVSAAVCTADGFLVLGRRNAKVTTHPGLIQAVGGMVESGPAGGPPLNPADVVERELEEELGIPASDLLSNELIGMVRDKQIVQPELIFDFRVAADVPRLRRFVPPPEHQEHSELVPVREAPTAFVSFLEQNRKDLTPVAAATLLLHGLARWGAGWFASTRGYLRTVR